MISSQGHRDLTVLASGGLGDCLLLSPFLRHFRRTGRYRMITCAAPANAIQLFDRSPRVDRVVPCQGRDLFLWGLPEKHSDVFSPYRRVEARPSPSGNFSLEARPRHNLNCGDEPVVEQLAKCFELDLEDVHLEMFTSPEDEDWADEIAASWGGRPAIFVNNTSSESISIQRMIRGKPSRKDREYPLPLWREVVARLRQDFLCIGISEVESRALGTETISPRPSLRQSAALFRRLHGVLTIDSFPGHLAAAVGAPAVVLFGPSNPKVFGHPQNRNLRSDVCPHCFDTDRQVACERSICLEAIRPEAVVEAAEQCFATPSRGN